MMQALPKALAQRGHRVMCIAPRYKQYDVSIVLQGKRGVLQRREGLWCIGCGAFRRKRAVAAA